MLSLQLWIQTNRRFVNSGKILFAVVDLLAIGLSCHVSTSTLDAVRIATKCRRTATDCMLLTLHKFILVLEELIHFAGAASAPEVILDQHTVLGVVIAERLLTF